jgi:hypothetical protein
MPPPAAAILAPVSPVSENAIFDIVAFRPVEPSHFDTVVSVNPLGMRKPHIVLCHPLMNQGSIFSL